MNTPEPTLRSRQKQKRFDAILAAANTVICEKSYDGASLQEIADRAEVGVATVYNYFGTKRALLYSLALVSAESLETTLDARGIPDDRSLEETLIDWVSEVVSQTLQVLDFRVWSAVIREAYRIDFETEIPGGYGLIKERFVSCNLVLLKTLRAHAMINEGTNDRDAAELLDALATEVFRKSLQRQKLDRRAIRAQAKRLVTPVVAGLGR